MRHVISLSSIPPRFADLGRTLAPLVAQSSRPEAVLLHIPRAYRRFPQWGGSLPDVPPGVTIVRTDDDHGPASKVLPAARSLRGQRVTILFGDDDIHYPPDWAARFLSVRVQHPGAAVCAAAMRFDKVGVRATSSAPEPRAKIAPPAREQPAYMLRLALRRAGVRLGPVSEFSTPFRKLYRSGHVDLFEAYAGVAVSPDDFDDEAFVIPPVVWAVDDVWLSGQLARRGVPVWADHSLDVARSVIEVSNTFPLNMAVLDGANRQAANRACIRHMQETYGIWGGVADQST